MNITPTLLLTILLLCNVFITTIVSGQDDMTRKEYLEQLLKALPEERPVTRGDQLPGTPPAWVSPDDFMWGDWQKRTGELPPDFDAMPNLPFLPNPLILDEGGENIPVTTIKEWLKKRDQMKTQAQYWITGTIPPPPENMLVEIIDEKKIGQLTERRILLKFGPGHEAQLHVSLLIPPGEGPFPVFICPWKKDRYDYVEAAVRRGYIGCRFTATDPKYGFPDDSEKYEKLWWPEYDFATVMRWGWAASRAIDYLYMLDNVNTDQIALTGLSRNGKLALWAAAYDDRIKAVVPISGGTGGENPFRYTMARYNSETMELLTRARPHWLHPRLRFFVGRENKLPVDMNSLMALIAPRGLMLTSAITESAGNPWGIEQAFLSAKEAYKFLGAEDNIAIDLRYGLHAPSARDMERYLNFFDFVFGRGKIRHENRLLYDYSFSKWLGLSGEMTDPLSFPEKGISDLLITSEANAIKDLSAWEVKATEIRQRIDWGLGNEPPTTGPGPAPDYLKEVVGFPVFGTEIESIPLLFGRLYYHSDGAKAPKVSKMPVVIYLHEYAYSTGFSKGKDIIRQFMDAGYAVYVFDQVGFGTRVEEGQHFYENFPHWSKLGRMVADVRWAVDVLSKLEFIDDQQIYTAGYSLGATVSLYSAAMDERIAGVVSVSGFTPMRLNTTGKTAEGIYGYSHLHGLLPRLGFFIGEENRIPYDFHEILACIAPRPLLVVAPTWDQYASLSDVGKCMDEVEKVYGLFGHKNRLKIYAPEDYNHFSNDMKKYVVNWMEQNLK